MGGRTKSWIWLLGGLPLAAALCAPAWAADEQPSASPDPGADIIMAYLDPHIRKDGFSPST